MASRERLAPETGPTRPPKPARTGSRFWGSIRAIIGLFSLLVLLGVLAVGAFAWHTYDRYAAELPSLDGLRTYQPKVMSRVYAGDDRLMAEFATERRIFVPIAAIPDVVKQAFISAEDQKFWTHRGVDPLAIMRAGLSDIMSYGSGKRPIGASTITQQVAKNMLLGNEVSMARKVKELILALRIDETMSKEHVLELYLNEIYLGQQAYGVAAAAASYFNKTLDELTLPEAAFLAVLPKAPNNYNPFRNADAAKIRRDWVLDRMADDHAITVAQAQAAKATPIQPAAFRRQEPVAGGEWYAEEVRRQLIDNFGTDLTTTGGYTIRTSLDPALQVAADKALRAGLMSYDRNHGGWRGPVGHLAGDASLSEGWSNRLSEAARPPGMLAEWRLAVVLTVDPKDAKLGWIERAGGAAGGGQSRTGTLSLSDLAWARPRHGTARGASPRKMADVVAVGDLVMVEPQGAVAADGKQPARPDRLLLRQIPEVQGALVSMEPQTGRVLAMVGGWSFEASQFNRATQAERQPGSSFKPMVYLTALEAGLSPSQRVLDSPFEQRTSQGVWRPNNFGMTFSGPIAMRVALEKSLNLVTIRLADKVGMDAVAQNAMAFHVVDGMPKVLPAALGAVETTVLRQASAYSGLAMGGKEVLPSLIDGVQDQGRQADLASVRNRLPGLPRPGQAAHPGRQPSPDRRPGQHLPAHHHDAGRGEQGVRLRRWRRAGPQHRGQDRHHAGQQRRLVRRLHARPRHRRLGRLRQQCLAWREGDRLLDRGSDLARLHVRRPQESSDAAIQDARWPQDGHLGQRLRPAHRRVQGRSAARRQPGRHRRKRRSGR